MVMKVEPLVKAIEAIARPGSRRVLLSPRGYRFTQQVARELAGSQQLVLVCGRYEGVDARVGAYVDDELSIGDYVLSGGEPAALIMIDAIGRLMPGVLGNCESAPDDSFGGGAGAMAGLLEGPVFTRPRVWRGREVPPVLLSGDHAAIARWRRDEALRRTAVCRPDLVAVLPPDTLDERDRLILNDAGFPLSGEDMAH